MEPQLSLNGLDLLSSECIGHLTQYLTYQDVKALLQSGSRSFMSKIDRSVLELTISAPSLGRWPSHAFRFRNLKSLAVSSPFFYVGGIIYAPIIAEGDVLIPLEGHQMLTRLQIDSTLAFSILRPVHIQPTLHELLPRLTTLLLSSDGAFDNDMFGSFPPTLTSLSLCRTGTRSQYSLSHISMLPKNLESLHIDGMTLSEPADPIDDPEATIFPPDLTMASLRIFSKPETLIALLPHSIIDLNIRMDGGSGGAKPELRASQLLSRFENLSLLKVSTAYTQVLHLILDEKLPRSLLSLILPELSKACVGGLFEGRSLSDVVNAALPPNLTHLVGLSACQDLPDCYYSFPRLDTLWSSARITKSLLVKFPHLTTLTRLPSQFGPHEEDMLMELPKTLTKLTAKIKNEPAWLKAIESLISLQQLQIINGSDTMPSKGFWDVLHPRLTTIEFSVHHCESVGDICGNWRKLTDIELDMPDEAIVCENFLKDLTEYSSTGNLEPGKKPLRFSPCISTITLAMGSRFHMFGWALKDLPEVRFLNIRFYPIPEEQESDESRFELLLHLPDSTKSLFFTSPSYMHPKYLTSLPSQLHSLGSAPQMDPSWTKEQLLSLPPRLAFCSIGAINSDIDNELLVQYVPPSLVLALNNKIDPRASKERNRQSQVSFFSAPVVTI